MKYFRLKFLIAAQNYDVRRYAHSLELLDGVLGRFCLVFPAPMQKRNERDMNKKRVPLPLFQTYLSGSLKKGLALHISGRSSDLGDNDIGFGLLTEPVDKILYLLCYMRYDLYGLPQVFTSSLLVENVPVYSA